MWPLCCLPLTLELKECINPVNGFKIVLSHISSCETRNVIYYVQCVCLKVYVGISRRAVNFRILAHSPRIRNQVEEAPMVSHFIKAGHSPGHLSYFVFTNIKPLHIANVIFARLSYSLKQNGYIA